MKELEAYRIGLIGNGSWATAIAKILSKNLSNIRWWVKDDFVKGHLICSKHNPTYLTDVEFNPDQFIISTDINEVVFESDIIFLVVPSIYVEKCLERLNVPLKDKILVSSIKGIVPNHYLAVNEFLHQKHQVPTENMGVISGPCHAEEVALERLSYLTVAHQDPKMAEMIANCLRCDFIQAKITDDVIGTEYGAILKNIYAIAAGIAHGVGYGDNFQAVLMSNAIREMERLLYTIDWRDRDINDSAYLGDLLVTGYSFFSRNRMFGNMIGKGYTVKSAILEMNMVAEGYYATRGVYEMKDKFEVKCPIISAVYKILYQGKNPKKVMDKLTKKLD
ncbi:Glycerol-3-phosphate dehydrogenase [NAD(P)+] [Weeksella virosa]|uniref:NAD(P)H-dependent glycerol-3-phosphate dehydrogenase n=1 Tax=Weeksella virosa TaxID=1014 RepID=UPI000F70E45B|nr:NAD(P)H-dependent glycerol-3-phosphate dehydrogenase [Weeksella virosa]VEH64520.1 Glycerol-3-phosphate dehydrogenase [NAD(P)+] [Weeksella virosa]